MEIFPSHPTENNTFNYKVLIILMPILIFSISSLAYMIFQAETIEDFEDSFLIASASFATALNFSIIVFWKMTKMFKMIESFEKIIEKSKKKQILPFFSHF